MNEILLAVLVSIVSTVLYQLLFARRVSQIRLSLARAREGWARRRYVRIFIAAVRGQAAIHDTFMVSLLPILFAAAILLVAIVRLQEDSHLVRNAQVQTEVQSGGPDLNAERDKILGQAKRLIVVSRWTLGLLLAGFFSGMALWVPFVLLRRAFAYEVERFTLRIQGLATKVELAGLALAESRVRDESTLRAFVDLAADVAGRHGVRDLVGTFDLWSTGAQSGHDARRG